MPWQRLLRRGSFADMVICHLTASFLFGGAERQMLGLAEALRGEHTTVFVSFSEGGACHAFLNEAQEAGFKAIALSSDTPRLLAARREFTNLLREVKADVVVAHGYKSNLIGLLAARRLRIPIISVSHGWTRQCFKVRLYEALDRLLLRYVDKVVCVSEGQARKVRRAGVPEGKIEVIRDSVCAERFIDVDGGYRDQLELMFSDRPETIVGAAGRLSPEKGFKHFVDAAALLAHEHEDARFVLFGEGPLRPALEGQIEERGLRGRFHLAGFRADLDKFYPHLDLLVLPSFTEGLPNVVLEAFAAGVPVVATAVGGTPEAVQEGVNGYLVQPGDATALAKRIADMLSNPAGRREMGVRGQKDVRQSFSFAQQGREYGQLFKRLRPHGNCLDRA
jgi:glycosyltransferase involved in cell wall biosynthesis